MQLRWMILKNKTCAEAVEAYARQNGTTLTQAKKELECEEKPVLQVWTEEWPHWEDVDFVTCYRGECK